MATHCKSPGRPPSHLTAHFSPHFSKCLCAQAPGVGTRGGLQSPHCISSSVMPSCWRTPRSESGGAITAGPRSPEPGHCGQMLHPTCMTPCFLPWHRCLRPGTEHVWDGGRRGPAPGSGSCLCRRRGQAPYLLEGNGRILTSSAHRSLSPICAPPCPPPPPSPASVAPPPWSPSAFLCYEPLAGQPPASLPGFTPS